MKPEIKARWVAALRSGEYEKNQGCLKDSKKNCYCVMGVLVDLYIKETGESWKDKEDEVGIASYALMPPPRVIEWAQDRPISHLPNVEYKGHAFALGELNDVYNISLSEMADLIEEQF